MRGWWFWGWGGGEGEGRGDKEVYSYLWEKSVLDWLKG